MCMVKSPLGRVSLPADNANAQLQRSVKLNSPRVPLRSAALEGCGTDISAAVQARVASAALEPDRHEHLEDVRVELVERLIAGAIGARQQRVAEVEVVDHE